MSCLRNILLNVPQDSTFHPEGGVWPHTRAVRKSLDEAIDLFRVSRILALLGAHAFDPDPPARRLLRIAAWCHDVGKVRATYLSGGRWAAPMHDKPRYFNPVLRQLGSPWSAMWRRSSFEDRKAFVYLVTRHMWISDRRGLHPRVARALAATDPSRRNRAVLLIVLMLMDRLGCGRESRVEDARLAIAAVERTLESERPEPWDDVRPGARGAQ